MISVAFSPDGRTAATGSVDEKGEELQEELLKFSNDVRLQDDVTIIEVRFRGE